MVDVSWFTSGDVVMAAMVVGCKPTMPEASQERVKTLLWRGCGSATPEIRDRR
jgi:hypothetical protein